MKRDKHPYTARSSAIVVRHAVAIDERRAKFRQDLIGISKPAHAHPENAKASNGHLHLPTEPERAKPAAEDEEEEFSTRYRRSSVAATNRTRGRSVARGRRTESVSPGRQLGPVAEDDGNSMTTGTFSLPRRGGGEGFDFDDMQEEEADEALPQVRKVKSSGPFDLLYERTLKKCGSPVVTPT